MNGGVKPRFSWEFAIVYSCSFKLPSSACTWGGMAILGFIEQEFAGKNEGVTRHRARRQFSKAILFAAVQSKQLG